MQLIVLGVGSSAGTPAIACDCATCTSTNPRNKRTRSSAAIETDDGKIILIDTGPDIRLQVLRESILRVDAVLYTHTHADHLNGIDDLRGFCQKNKMQIPLYGNAPTIDNISTRFGYTLREPSDHWDLPVLSANIINAPFELCGEKVTPIPIIHGRAQILGFRIRNFAYLTDVSEIPETSIQLLQGLDVLLLDCLRHKPHPTHISVEQSLAYASQIMAKETFLIHMTHDIEYAALQAILPQGIHVGYDGLRLTLA
jgi:phosphoribosyl 1,2-cyclic phosphate phosphodiesterase